MKHREHKIAFLLCSLTCLSSVFAGDENTSNTAPDKIFTQLMSGNNEISAAITGIFSQVA